MATESKDRTAASFEPVDPWKSEDLLITRRNLPHLNVPGATYFLTFRSKIFLPPNARDLVIAVIREFTGQHIDLDAAVVMPDHVHLILRLRQNETLGRVLHLIKGKIIHAGQSARRQTGPALDG
jgi:REP element-mobilizing transposase RayT